METIEQKELVHPVAVQMSLTRAFKARKDLNNMIQRMGQTLRRIRPFVHETELPAELTNLTTDSVENDIIEVEKLLHTKMTLDIAIEQSNVEGQIKLAQIDKCNKTISLLSDMQTYARGAKNTDRFFNNVTGKYEVEVLTPVMPSVDFFDAPIMKATNLKRDLEEELQAFNNLTKIAVPMDVELAGKLGFNVE